MQCQLLACTQDSHRCSCLKKVQHEPLSMLSKKKQILGMIHAGCISHSSKANAKGIQSIPLVQGSQWGLGGVTGSTHSPFSSLRSSRRTLHLDLNSFSALIDHRVHQCCHLQQNSASRNIHTVLSGIVLACTNL